MFYLKLGWRNLWRNKRRSAIELTSIMGSVFLAVSYNNLAKGSYTQMIEEAVKMGSGHVGLYHQAYLEDRKTEQVILPDSILPQLDALPGVRAVNVRLYVPGLVRSSRDSRPTMVIGVDPERADGENPLFRSEAYVQGEPLDASPERSRYLQAVIGQKLADDLGLKLRRKFVWMAQDTDGEMISLLMRVSGIIRTGISDIDGGTVLVRREALAAAIGALGSAHEVAIMLDSQDGIEAALIAAAPLASSIAGAAAYPWQQAMPALSSAIRMDYAGLKILVGFIYFLVGIGTINTMLMSVMERTREFGVVRSLGLRASGVRRMIFVEALVLSLVGVTLGLAAAGLLGMRMTSRGVDMSGMFGDGDVEFAGILMDPVVYAIWDIPGMATFSLAMVVLTLFAALYPAHRALKIGPADAMRHY